MNSTYESIDHSAEDGSGIEYQLILEAHSGSD
jgi:hypothetical protein